MWWVWPHLRRLWAGLGTITAGLVVTYLYSLISEQALPQLRIVANLAQGYWLWFGGTALALIIVSVLAERAHRRHTAPRFIGEERGRKGAKLAPLAAATTNSNLIVGRNDELKQLRDWYSAAASGERRVIFIAGEVGIGKTTFVNTFIDSLHREGVRIARGQCVEQYGAGEPYMPMLEALTQLGQGAESQQLLAILHRLAPAWLAQLPALLTAEERARIQGETQGLTQQRMLREMAQTLAALASDAPLVLLLEDLHWSDASTLDLIATIARRTEPARLLILGTYRPVEMLAGDHPLRALKEELEVHHQCQELRLKLLSEAEVAAYLKQRFASDGARYSGLAPAIYQRTDGNALFMVNVVDYLVAQGPSLDTSKIETPRNIRQMIERNLRRLDADEQAVLEAASVAGAEFSAAAVAAALERPVSEIDACCTRLARDEQFIRSEGASRWPDGTLVTGYRFVHALYQEVLYDHAPVVSRAEAHRRIAAREEAAYGEQAGEIAAELAEHYGRANDRIKAVQYFEIAGNRAAGRSAMVEAVRHYVRALELLSTLPENGERDRREVDLQLALGPALTAVKGFAAAETGRAYVRARELCERVGATTEELSPALFGLWVLHLVRGDLRKAHELAEGLVRLAQSAHDPALRVYAQIALGHTFLWRGDFISAREHLESAISTYDPEHHPTLALRYLGFDAAVYSLSGMALTLWQLGYPDEALMRGKEALALAQRLTDPQSLVLAERFIGEVHLFRREAGAAQENAENVIALSAERGFSEWFPRATTLRGGAIALNGRHEEGIGQIQEGLAALRATGFELWRPSFLCLLAEASMELGRLDEGLSALTEALAVANKNEEREHEAEIHRLKGELLMKQHDPNTAEAQSCFERAIGVARKQSARSLELRATTSLARLLALQGRRDEARTMLAAIYNWFTEGFDTKDLIDAKALLNDLK